MRTRSPLDRAGCFALRALLAIFIAATLTFLLLPITVVVPMSFSDQLYLTFPPTGWALRWYSHVWEQARWLRAAWNSIVIGVPVALLSIAFGTATALAAARSGIRWMSGVSVLVLAPMMLPHIIIAIGLYPTMLDLSLANTYAAVIIGHTVVATPLVFISVTASLKNYDQSLELAAMTLGANWWRSFTRITFPMIRVGIAVGGILAFATSFDELMLSLFLTSPRTETLPRLIWDHLAYTVTPEIAAVGSLVLALSLLLLVIAASLRSSGAAQMLRADPR
jgi:ABC-type spermidine/putrescine transport system permease subunit II